LSYLYVSNTLCCIEHVNVRNIASVCIKPDLFQWTFINMCNKVCHTVGENALTVNGSDKKVRIILFILDFKIGNGRQSKRLLDDMGWIFLFLCFFLLIQRCCMQSVIGLRISGCNNVLNQIYFNEHLSICVIRFVIR
jgi:hypothetical protein